jgi:hypothetical protein
MKRMQPISILPSLILLLFLAGSGLCAEEGHFYGVVESFGGGRIVVRTTEKSTGHWKVDSATRVTGSVAHADWVFVEVERSGHVRVLRFEERPTPHSGVVKEVHGRVLSVHSGPNMETWNLTETTITEGISASDVTVGDQIAVKLYRNHNLAEIRVIKRGVR